MPLAVPAVDTPMMEQWRRLKAECGEAFLFFRLGDFYELFGEDAERAAPILEVTLTSREATPGVRVPMCGVPHHAVHVYAARLLARGCSVAIADQVEDSATARGLVRREITRVLTPGTVSEPELLESLGESLLVAAAGEALAVADTSTGTVRVALAAGEEAVQELARLGPAEIVVPEGQAPDFALTFAREAGLPVRARPAHEFDPDEAARLWPGQDVPRVAALGGLLAYLRYVLRGELGALRPPEVYRPSAYLALDAAAQRNLELVQRLGGGSGPGTLLHALDRTVTAMGRRTLRFWLLHPLRDVAEIGRRLDAVEELARRPLFREGLRAALRRVYDLERLAARTVAQRATPRELGALGASLRALPEALGALRGCAAPLLAELVAAVDPLEEVADLLGRALAEDLPASARDGGIFAPGYDAVLDELRAAATEGRSWLAELEARERARTGIRSLKVGFNKVFGYYIEVSTPNLAAVPADYVRKQTVAGGERFVTPELKRLEERVLGSEEKALRREQALFAELRARVAGHGPTLQRTARAVAALDALAAMAETAARWGWTRPVVDRSTDLVIRAGRHPVLEQEMPAGRFVPNDTQLTGRDQRLLLLTGPNMAGKSTYMRQVALIVLLAHMGSFVPAAEARVGLVDRIFTRVGASDDLAGGRSTFMVEMTEVATCLRHATRRSLILLDEVGRGTGTLDGLAIAWAVAEALARLGARTLFATHYHELTAVAATLPGAGNAHVAVREEGGRVVFLHRVAPGATDRSYGIAVAALAGVPEPVLARARELLGLLQAGRSPAEGRARAEAAAADGVPADAREQARRALLRRLAAVDPLRLTPLQALDLLAVLQAEASTLVDDG
jgi:DNA mismatch repair protein MutS